MAHLRYIVTGTGRSGTVGLAGTLTELGIPCSHERFFNGSSLDETLRLLESNGGENSFCSRHSGLPLQTDQVAAESSYMAAPYLDQPCFADATIIHAVRNPWKVILSFLNHLQFFRGEPEHEHEQFVYSVLPSLHQIDNCVDRAVYFYICWNRMIEERSRKLRMKRYGGLLGLCQRRIEKLSRQRQRGCYIFHRIEDGPTALVKKLGMSKEHREQCPKKTNVNAFKEWPRELGAYAPIRRITIEQINTSKYSSELRRLARRYGYQAPLSEEAPGSSASDAAELRNDYEVRFTPKPRLLEDGYRGYNLVRWKDDCYALPQGEALDLESASEDSLAGSAERGEIVVAARLSELKAKVDAVSNERVDQAVRKPPILVASGYRCYNLVLWQGQYYALHQDRLAKLTLETAAAQVLRESLEQRILLVAPSLREAKGKVDQVAHK